MSQVHVPEKLAEFPVNYAFNQYAPEMGDAMVNLSLTVFEHTRLSLREMEAARMRTAQINGCTICQSGRAARDFDKQLPTSGRILARPMASRGAVPDDAFYDAIENWEASGAFTPRERLAIEFAERMGEQPRSLQGDDVFWDRAHSLFSDRELVDLALSIGSWIAFGRVTHVLELDSICSLQPQPA